MKIPTIPARFGIRRTLIGAMLIPSLVWLFVSLFLFATGEIGPMLLLFCLVNLLYPISYLTLHFRRPGPRFLIDIIADACIPVGLVFLCIA
jgi:hypothetical protein